MPEDYPKGMVVAGGGPLEQHWALTSERQRQDKEARVAWAQVLSPSFPPSLYLTVSLSLCSRAVCA